MGIEFRESDHVISSRCARALHAGMILNLILGFQDLVDPHAPADARSKTYALLLADTVHVGAHASALLTDAASSLTTISYAFKAAKHQQAAAPATMLRSRARAQQQAGASEDKRRREHQLELAKLRTQEALRRHTKEADGSEPQKAVETVRFESYRKDTQLPEHRKGDLQITVDRKNDSLLLPVFGLLVPVHIATVKNVAKSDEGDYTYLRINLSTPGRVFGKKDAAPLFDDPAAEFVRTFTFRTADTFHAHEVFKEIQDLKKHATERDIARKEMADLVVQDKLVEMTGTAPRLQPS